MTIEDPTKPAAATAPGATPPDPKPPAGTEKTDKPAAPAEPPKLEIPARTSIEAGDAQVDMTAEELKRYAARGYQAEHVDGKAHQAEIAKLNEKAKVHDLLQSVKMNRPDAFKVIAGLIQGDPVPTKAVVADPLEEPATPAPNPGLSPAVEERLNRMEARTEQAVSRLETTETSGVIKSVLDGRPAIVENVEARAMVEQEARNLVAGGVDAQAAALRAATKMERLLTSAAQGAVDQRRQQQETMKAPPVTATPGLSPDEKPMTSKDLRSGVFRTKVAELHKKFQAGELFGTPPQ